MSKNFLLCYYKIELRVYKGIFSLCASTMRFPRLYLLIHNYELRLEVVRVGRLYFK